MKKLMIAAAIVCAAAMSQAASCSWQTDWVYSVGTSRDTYNEGGMGGYYWVVLSSAAATTSDIDVSTDGTISLGEGFSLVADKTAITKDNPKSEVSDLAVANNGKYLTLVI